MDLFTLFILTVVITGLCFGLYILYKWIEGIKEDVERGNTGTAALMFMLLLMMIMVSVKDC